MISEAQKQIDEVLLIVNACAEMGITISEFAERLALHCRHCEGCDHTWQEILWR